MTQHHAWRVGPYALGLFLWTAAWAEPVAPGGRFTDEFLNEEFPPPAGTEVARRQQELTIEFTEAAGAPLPLTAVGTFTHTVLRDDDTGRLTFVYELGMDDSQPGVSEDAVITAGGFAGFFTDVRAHFDAPYNVARSADGNTITARNASSGNFDIPILVIETDATEFDDGGTFSYRAFGETYVPELERVVFPVGQVNFETFRPAADDGVVIPLPAPFALGLAGLGGAGLARVRNHLRRKRGD